MNWVHMNYMYNYCTATIIITVCICKCVYYQTVANGITTELDAQIPEYILPKDNFNISCRASNPVRLMVRHCHIKSKSSLKINGHYHENRIVEHVHVKKPCKVLCFSGSKHIRKTIPVIGKLLVNCTSKVSVYT